MEKWPEELLEAIKDLKNLTKKRFWGKITVSYEDGIPVYTWEKKGKSLRRKKEY